MMGKGLRMHIQELLGMVGHPVAWIQGGLPGPFPNSIFLLGAPSPPSASPCAFGCLSSLGTASLSLFYTFSPLSREVVRSVVRLTSFIFLRLTSGRSVTFLLERRKVTKRRTGMVKLPEGG